MAMMSIIGHILSIMLQEEHGQVIPLNRYAKIM